MPIHFYKLVVKEVRKEAADAISVSFDIPDALKSFFVYQPGQNITLKALIEGVEIRRSYSICSAPHENELRIAIREVRGGKFSEWANKSLLIGVAIDVLPPTGRFTVLPDVHNSKKYLAIAAGSGITPILSIISSLLMVETHSSVTLLFSNRTQAHIMFKETLGALKNRYMQRLSVHHFLSREATETEIYNGRIDAARLTELNRTLIDFKLFDETLICGPAPMLFEVKNWLGEQGVSPGKIHYELFTPPGIKDAINDATSQELEATTPGSLSPAVPQNPDSNTDVVINAPVFVQTPTVEPENSRITIRSDGYSFDFTLEKDGEKILNAALALGADLPYSCKGGVCGTCRARLVAGEVKMDLNYALELEEVRAGFILCCQSHPVSDEVVIDFD